MAIFSYYLLSDMEELVLGDLFETILLDLVLLLYLKYKRSEISRALLCYDKKP